MTTCTTEYDIQSLWCRLTLPWKQGEDSEKSSVQDSTYSMIPTTVNGVSTHRAEGFRETPTNHERGADLSLT